MNIIFAIIKLIIILGVVTTIHEFGHFLFSKLFKIGVNEFSIGFGPALFQKKRKETVYSLRAIPLGGYCAIEGEGSDVETENSFAKKSWIKKMIVLVAGVAFNAILAAVVFITIAFCMPTYTTKITKLAENSVLEKSGITIGDEITKINDKKVRLYSDIVNFGSDINNNKKDVVVKYIHNGKEEETIVKDAIKDIGYIGVSFKVENNTNVTNVIDIVASGSAAVKADLKSSDKVIEVNGVKTDNSIDVIGKIRNLPNKEIDIKIERNGKVIDKKVNVDSKKIFSLDIEGTKIEKTNLSLAMYSSLNKAKTIVSSYADLFKGKLGIKDMSGIVGIGEVVYKTSGFLEFINLIGIISLAVGVANLLPFPPLDGGKALIVTIEAITKKKLPVNIEAIISYIGMGLLLLLTLIVTINDIIRII